MLIRELDYLKTYGIYQTRSEVTYEVGKSGFLSHIQFDLLRVVFDPIHAGLVMRPVESQRRWRVILVDARRFLLTFDLSPGYYLLVAKLGIFNYALPIVVYDRTQAADVAVIRPVFTQWSYHWAGFYFNERQSLADRVLGTIGRLGLVGRVIEQSLRQSAYKLGLQGINFPYRSFPAHSSVNLCDFYRRNNRWDRTMWNAQLGRLEGIWCDEMLSGMPVFALLDKNDRPYHVFTDVDLHNQNKLLETYRVLIFSGQEGMTPTYYQMLQRLQATGKTSFLLWGVQGFGYRQLDYNDATGELKYICTRGRQGMWGDRLEERQPDWGDEAQIFGFHFPEPQSASWRYDTPYSRIKVHQSDHPITRMSNTAGKNYCYDIRDLKGKSHPGLTWAGGEIQQRVSQDATVIAHLDEDPEVIGIGEYRNTILFAPTYLPAFFAYQGEAHPEVAAWFIGALNYLLDRKSNCVYA